MHVIWVQYTVTSALFRLIKKFVSCHYLKLRSAVLPSSEQYCADVSMVLSKQKDFSRF